MKIVPTVGPVIESAGAQSANQKAARERAVAAFTKGSPAELNAMPSQTPKTAYPPSQRPQLTVGNHPVQDPSNVAVEELAAIAAEEPAETIQENTNEVAETAATPEPEATPAPVTEEAPQLSSQYAQLARKEKAMRAQVMAAKAQEAQLKAREDALKAKEAEMESRFVPKERITKDPYKVLTEQGFTPEQIANLLLNAPDPAQQQQLAVIERLEAKIAALEDGQTQTKKTFEDSQRQSYTQAVNMIRNEAASLVSKDPNFETIHATDSVEDVVELITKTFEKDGIMMTVEEAATAVEDHLAEEVERLARLKKIQQRLSKTTPAPAKPAATQQVATATKTQPTKTLTSAMTNTRPLSAKERAILAFKGELKD